MTNHPLSDVLSQNIHIAGGEIKAIVTLKNGAGGANISAYVDTVDFATHTTVSKKFVFVEIGKTPRTADSVATIKLDNAGKLASLVVKAPAGVVWSVGGTAAVPTTEEVQ